ncbi:WD40 repeat-like protein [Rickenella mellea]|uniref:WD40 repeat-like protein n=1 Tax=Rickenella mellea TaxID=50990 RepID=A0A4Y7QBH7_9AGAM|nr:WD40 repeat-like protein [Rickenella mellea]
MRFPDNTDQDSALSVSLDFEPEAGPSSVALNNDLSAAVSNGNGHAVSNGHGGPLFSNGASSSTNGKLTAAGYASKGSHAISRVSLPGTKLYEDSHVDREEFVRLVIQSLRDVGYIESAATLEAESGYTMESPEVAEFRECILDGSWDSAEVTLSRLGVSDDESLRMARFLISQQKYLELLEASNVNAALHVLRSELAPLNTDVDKLHSLSGLIMCSNAEDLKSRAKWDGAAGVSRRQLLANLQRFIPSSVMIPQRRFASLLQQAYTHQRTQCLYHNAPYDSSAFSLYTDHHCSRDSFPSLTTHILAEHEDEVWNVQWSHCGRYLASASKDKTAIVWHIGVSLHPLRRPKTGPNTRDCIPEKVLRDHPYPVGCLAWSLDDSILLTSSEHIIKMWNPKTGLCVRELDAHTETVTSLVWLPDGSGFLSGSMDRKIILWDVDGKQRDTWGTTVIRVTDLAVTPDFSRLVAVGIHHLPSSANNSAVTLQDGGTPPTGAATQASTERRRDVENRLIIYDLATKQQEVSIRLEGELTSVKISQDSRYALVNHAPDEVQLWDLDSARMARRFTGQRQGKHVIRSCFGGVDGNFIVSGSEDGNVYVWHRDTGALLEALPGHGEGSVNSAAWNPKDERMFASCSDDCTIRIWEIPPPEMMEAVGSPMAEQNGKGKGRSRDGWDGTG